MPRNGSNVYSLPAGSTVTDGQTILASQHNGPLNDLATELNDNLTPQLTAVDTATSRVLRNGAWGMGAETPPSVTNIDDTTLRTGWYRTETTTTGTFPGAAAIGSLRVERQGTTGVFQEFKDANAVARWVRAYAGSAWGTWQRLLQSNDPTGVLSGSGLGFSASGGTVAQATDKTTSVTLNTHCGRIDMHAASLAAGASVAFQLTNSTISPSDLVIVHTLAFTGYRVEVRNVATGAAVIRVTNVTGGALAEAVTLNFAVIQGVIA